MQFLKTRVKFTVLAVAVAIFSHSLSAEEDSPKEQILALVQQNTMSEEQFSVFDRKSEMKLKETPFSEADFAAKPELSKIYEMYHRAIEAHRANLKAQYDLGQKVVQQIRETDELTRIGEIVQAFQAAISPVCEEHKALEAQIKDLELKIIPLLPSGTELFY